MTNRKRPQDNGKAPLRQNLPRRCKEIHPCYAFDLDFEDEDEGHGTRTNKKVSGNSYKRALPVTNNVKQEVGIVMRHIMMPLTILSWLFEMKVVQENEPIYYMNMIDDLFAVDGEGKLTRNGIQCSCCNGTYSISSFQNHRSNLFRDVRPYESIFIGNTRVSLLTCLIEAWNNHSVPAKDGYHHVVRGPGVRDNHDDSCLICADGGGLICCERCPSTYHHTCLGLEVEPQGDWLCPYCRCKYCDRDRSEGILLTCFQCLKKYHWRCSQLKDKIPQELNPPKTPCCGKKCLLIHRNLEDMVGRSNLINVKQTNRFSWTLVRRMEIRDGGKTPQDLSLRVRCNTMVALAAKLLEDSFSVIVDRHSRTNMIQGVVYSCGSNYMRTNFSKFYTAVLEHDGRIITVASLRMASPTLLEIPFIATAEWCRKMGMCDLLLRIIKRTFGQIGAERIVIPSANEMLSSWQTKFGFTPLDDVLKGEITKLNTLMFPKTTRLQSDLTKIKMEIGDLNSPPQEDCYS